MCGYDRTTGVEDGTKLDYVVSFILMENFNDMHKIKWCKERQADPEVAGAPVEADARRGSRGALDDLRAANVDSALGARACRPILGSTDGRLAFSLDVFYEAYARRPC